MPCRAAAHGLRIQLPRFSSVWRMVDERGHQLTITYPASDVSLKVK
jgi:hypothetical protein